VNNVERKESEEIAPETEAPNWEPAGLDLLRAGLVVGKKNQHKSGWQRIFGMAAKPAEEQKK
jgi:hypothetical protein